MLLARIDGRGTLHFVHGPVPDVQQEHSFILDTGFTGSISLSEDVLRRIAVGFLGYMNYRLADGRVVPQPVYRIRVSVGGSPMDAPAIPGEPLVGMELLIKVGRAIHIRLDPPQSPPGLRGEVTIELR